MREPETSCEGCFREHSHSACPATWCVKPIEEVKLGNPRAAAARILCPAGKDPLLAAQQCLSYRPRLGVDRAIHSRASVHRAILGEEAAAAAVLVTSLFVAGLWRLFYKRL